MQESAIVIIVIAAITVAVLYFLLLWRRRPTELWTWTSTLLATLISIVLGIAVALALFRYTTAQGEASARTRFRHLLRAEMSDTFRILSSGETMGIITGQSTQNVLVTYIQPLAIEQSAQSGLFDEVTTENLLLLARTMRVYNLKIQYLLSALAAGQSSEAMRHAVGNVEETRQAILNDLRFMMKKLQMDFSPSVQVK